MRSTRSIGLGMLSVLFGVGAVLGGCGGGAASTPPATTATSAQPEDDEPAADLTEHHRHHHHGGVTMFIAMSLDTLGVSPEQTAAIEKIQADLFAKMEPAHAAEQGLVTTLADGVAAGAIDQAKLDAALAQVSAASASVHEASADALNQLHTALTPEQRATLVDKVEAHWAVWKRVNAEQESVGQDSNHDGVVSPSEMGHLEKLGKELGLTPDQTEKAKAAFGTRMQTGGVKFDPAQVEAHIQEFGTAFKAEKFDAHTLQRAGGANSHVAGWGARRMAHFYAALTPVLTPEQRTKLSAKLRERATQKAGT
jgi:Spy/CpxP family protein refolding chaperone